MNNIWTLAIVISIFIALSYIIFTTTTSCSRNDREFISKLIRQTARWATAAEQDTNPYIANLHATYSLGYLMALRELYDDATILRLSNVNVRKLEKEVTKTMDLSIEKLIITCPEGQPKNKFLAYLSKQGSL